MFAPEETRRVVIEAMHAFASHGWAVIEGPYQDQARARAWMHGLDMANERKEPDTALRLWRDKQTNKRQGPASRHGLTL